MTFQSFSEANPDFSAYMVIGGHDYEGESSYSTRLFDSKQLSLDYTQKLLEDDGFDYVKMHIISNDGTLWNMPGAHKFFTLENGKLISEDYTLPL